MDIGRLTSGILAEARAEAEAVAREAEARKREALSGERQKSAAMLSDAKAEAEKFVSAQKRERVAWAKLEAKKLLGEARETVVREAMDGLYKGLSSFRRDKRYAAFLNARIAEGIEELSVPSPVVYVCRGDSGLVAAKGATVKEELSGMGGAIVASSDGSVRVDYTLETLFEEKRELLRKKVYEMMFR